MIIDLMRRTVDGLWRTHAGGRMAAIPGIMLLILAGATGCSLVPDAANPVEWYKGVRGMILDDKTQEQREAEAEARRTPLPGANGPFPNLATVPPRPTSTEEPAAQTRDRLFEDRGSARDDDTRMRELEAERAKPPPPAPTARKATLAVAGPDERAAPSAPPPSMPKLTRPPPPPGLGVVNPGGAATGTPP